MSDFANLTQMVFDSAVAECRRPRAWSADQRRDAQRKYIFTCRDVSLEMGAAKKSFVYLISAILFVNLDLVQVFRNSWCVGRPEKMQRSTSRSGTTERNWLSIVNDWGAD